MIKRGKLIVIDGTDGSGKATQSKILVKKLKDMGKKVKYLDFPRYEKSFYGKVIRRFLDGEFGQMEEINPYLIAIVYAADRQLVAGKIKDWLSKGIYVVSNRYTSGNVHQIARVEKGEQEKLAEWLDEMEYEVNGLPREDLNLFLYVSAEICEKLMRGRQKDMAEKDTTHQKKALKIYSAMAEEKANWRKIICFNRQGIYSRRKIADMIWQEVERVID